MVSVNLKCGSLRHRIRIEQQVEAKNSFGETSVEWEEFGTYWAQIRPLSAREQYTAQETQPELSAVIVMRYVAGINASMRAVHVVNGTDGTIYNLSAPIRDPETGMDWMSLPASAFLNEG